jgi:TRAP-type mannitol/chloroaromatic compound transport system permease small subunit
LHSYAAGDTPIFPVWAWILILAIVSLMVISGIRQNIINKRTIGRSQQTGE